MKRTKKEWLTASEKEAQKNRQSFNFFKAPSIKASEKQKLQMKKLGINFCPKTTTYKEASKLINR